MHNACDYLRMKQVPVKGSFVNIMGVHVKRQGRRLICVGHKHAKVRKSVDPHVVCTGDVGQGILGRGYYAGDVRQGMLGRGCYTGNVTKNEGICSPLTHSLGSNSARVVMGIAMPKPHGCSLGLSAFSQGQFNS